MQLKSIKLIQIIIGAYSILQIVDSKLAVHKQLNNSQYSIHDQTIMKQSNGNQNKRIIGSYQTQPLKIKFDFKLINENDKISIEQREMILNACLSASKFISDLISIVPYSQPLQVSQKDNNICIDTPISQELIEPNYVEEADLFVIMNSFDETSSSVSAVSAVCVYYSRPIVGRIKLNLGKFNKLTQRTHRNLLMQIIIHELIHILGFSNNSYFSWINPNTNQIYGLSYFQEVINKFQLNNQDYNVFVTPNLKEVFNQHYNCYQVTGMPIEIDSNSHWSPLMVKNELMNPVLDDYTTDLSQFTIALLKDTNYYSKINENLQIYSGWGYNRGCDYVTKSCNKQQREKYLTYELSIAMQYDCDPAGYGKSNLFQIIKQENCLVQDLSKTQFCTQIGIQSINPRGEEYILSSKCFRSSFKIPTIENPFMSEYQNTRCYRTECQEDGTIIIKPTFGIQLTCKFPGEFIEVEKLGYLQCPNNFDLFCQNRKLFCLNDCSLKGYCLKGQCVCIKGYAGTDCSITLNGSNMVLFKNQQVNQCLDGEIQNLNNVCIGKCPSGFYRDNQSNSCKLCNNKCQECLSDLECTKCNFGYVLISQSCISKQNCEDRLDGCLFCASNSCIQCRIGYFLNEKMECNQCSISCKECINNKNTCISCTSDFILQNSTCIQITDKQKNCEILAPQNPQLCLKCKPNYFIDQSNCIYCQPGSYWDQQAQQCIKCSSNCKECNYQPDLCTQCFDDGFLNMKSRTCVSINLSNKSLKDFKQNLQSLEDYELTGFLNQDNNPMNCHYSCEFCSGESYSQCLMCKGNREFKTTISIFLNYCDCPEQSTDQGFEGCSYKYSFYQLEFTLIIFSIIYLIQKIMNTYFDTEDAWVILIYIDFFQSVSYLRFFDHKFYYEVDSLWRNLQFFNLFNIQVIGRSDQIKSQIMMNNKFLLDNKTPNFLFNSLILIIIIFLINIIAILIKKINHFKSKQSASKIQLILLLINLFSLNEVTLNLYISYFFISVQQIKEDVAMAVFGLFLLIFIIVQSVFIIRKFYPIKIYSEKKVDSKKVTLKEAHSDRLDDLMQNIQNLSRVLQLKSRIEMQSQKQSLNEQTNQEDIDLERNNNFLLSAKSNSQSKQAITFRSGSNPNSKVDLVEQQDIENNNYPSDIFKQIQNDEIIKVYQDEDKESQCSNKNKLKDLQEKKMDQVKIIQQNMPIGFRYIELIVSVCIFGLSKIMISILLASSYKNPVVFQILLMLVYASRMLILVKYLPLKQKNKLYFISKQIQFIILLIITTILEHNYRNSQNHEKIASILLIIFSFFDTVFGVSYNILKMTKIIIVDCIKNR